MYCWRRIHRTSLYVLWSVSTCLPCLHERLGHWNVTAETVTGGNIPKLVLQKPAWTWMDPCTHPFMYLLGLGHSGALPPEENMATWQVLGAALLTLGHRVKNADPVYGYGARLDL